MIEGRVLILLAYFERPVLVRNALNSIKKSHEHYDNWELAFCDDGSVKKGEDIVKEILADHLDRIKFYNTGSTAQEKLANGGQTGKLYNQVIQESDAEFVVILCDDDELHPEYLKNLVDYFRRNPKVNYCYSKVICYDPFVQTSEEALRGTLPLNTAACDINSYTDPIICAGHVDSAQVAWRILCNKQLGAWYPYPASTCLDLKMFNRLFEVAGPAFHTWFVSQFKGIHAKQLGKLTCQFVWEARAVDKEDKCES